MPFADKENNDLKEWIKAQGHSPEKILALSHACIAMGVTLACLYEHKTGETMLPVLTGIVNIVGDMYPQYMYDQSVQIERDP